MNKTRYEHLLEVYDLDEILDDLGLEASDLLEILDDLGYLNNLTLPEPLR